jgi:hypothetical protein
VLCTIVEEQAREGKGGIKGNFDPDYMSRRKSSDCRLGEVLGIQSGLIITLTGSRVSTSISMRW